MVAATVIPRTQEQWALDTCRAHQAYRTRREAERYADLHPITNVACPKCNDGRQAEVFRCYSDSTHWHWGHGRAWKGEQTMVAITSVPMPVMKRGGRPPKLSGEKAREIFQAVERAGRLSEAFAKQIGSRYGVSFATVYDIYRGRTYAWATADLRTRPPVQEAPVHVTTPPTVIVEVADTVAREDRPPLSMSAPALVTDLADALAVLLDYYGGETRPSRFLCPDFTAIRDLVAQARAAS